MLLRPSLLAAVAPFALLLAGCGSESRPKVEVKGTIQFKDGKPLPAGVTVVLNPVEGKMGTASGKTDTSGAFQLTHASGSGGAEVGKYTVSLIAPSEDKDFYKQVPKEVFDGGLLTADVKEGMGPLELTVPRAKGK